MKILMKENGLAIVKLSLTELEVENIEKCIWGGHSIEIKESESHYSVRGNKKDLYKYLYDATVVHDVELS